MNDKCYIISYEIAGDSTSLIAAIKGYGTWARINPTVWAIVSTKPATEIRDYLSHYISDGDRIFVIKSGVEAAWRNVICKGEWLKKNL